MLRWMCGKTRRDTIRNEDIRESVRITHIVEKMVKNSNKWFQHVDTIVRRINLIERRQTNRRMERLNKQIEEWEDLEKLLENLLRKISKLMIWIQS